MSYFQIVYKVARMLIHTVYKHTKKNKRCVIKNSTLISVITFPSLVTSKLFHTVMVQKKLKFVVLLTEHTDECSNTTFHKLFNYKNTLLSDLTLLCYITGIIVATLSLAVNPDELEFRANHPFLAIVVHRVNGVPLFAGRVSDPSVT